MVVVGTVICIAALAVIGLTPIYECPICLGMLRLRVVDVHGPGIIVTTKDRSYGPGNVMWRCRACKTKDDRFSLLNKWRLLRAREEYCPWSRMEMLEIYEQMHASKGDQISRVIE